MSSYVSAADDDDDKHDEDALSDYEVNPEYETYISMEQLEQTEAAAGADEVT